MVLLRRNRNSGAETESSLPITDRESHKSDKKYTPNTGGNVKCRLLHVIFGMVLGGILASALLNNRVLVEEKNRAALTTGDVLLLDNSKNKTTKVGPKSDWPGVPVEKLGYPLIKIGENFVAKSREILLANLNDFLEVYANRPDKVNMCGIRINHAYALFITVKYLQPSAIIESGVNAGQSTYFMRAASPDAKIYAIDPLVEPICGQKKRWMDTKNSEYFTGDTFQDLGSIDWDAKIKSKEMDPERTLVFLDDHLSVFDRWLVLMKHGFRHVVLEDNYKVKEGSSRFDKAGWTPKQMMARVDKDSEFMFNSLISYAEFPPLVAPILSKLSTRARKKAGGFMHHTDTNLDIVEPILRPENDEEDKKLYEMITEKLQIDPEIKGDDSYMQLMNYNQFSYFEIQPMSSRLLEEQKKTNIL